MYLQCRERWLFAGEKGLEPLTHDLTGRRSEPTELHPLIYYFFAFLTLYMSSSALASIDSRLGSFPAS